MGLNEALGSGTIGAIVGTTSRGQVVEGRVVDGGTNFPYTRRMGPSFTMVIGTYGVVANGAKKGCTIGEIGVLV